MAAQYDKANTAGTNALIVQDLRGQAGSSDKNVARAATFALSRLGYVDGIEEVLSAGLSSGVIRYSNWLQALATVRSSVMNKEGAEFILGKLNDERTEPRKVMAFFASEYAKKVVTTINQRARFGVALDRITLYSKQHPHNRDMKEIVDNTNRRLAMLPS